MNVQLYLEARKQVHTQLYKSLRVIKRRTILGVALYVAPGVYSRKRAFKGPFKTATGVFESHLDSSASYLLP